MRKATSFSRWSLLMGVACGLAMLPVANRTARAEMIMYTFDVSGVPVFSYVVPGSTATSSTWAPTDITTLNTALTGAGSAYTFNTLGGSSNWSGAPTAGVLNLTGIVTVGATGNTILTVTETEMGFIAPASGLPGTLTSSSSVTFNNPGTGSVGSQTTDSSFNATTTPMVTLMSSGTFPNSPPPGPPGSAPIVFTTPYTLDNYISFSLNTSTPGGTDNFTLAGRVTSVVVPEPSSAVIMLIGLPLSLVGLAWLRRRRTVVENS